MLFRYNRKAQCKLRDLIARADLSVSKANNLIQNTDSWQFPFVMKFLEIPLTICLNKKDAIVKVRNNLLCFI